VSSAFKDEELKRLAKELSNILQYDEKIITCYLFLLRENEEVDESKISEINDIQLSDASVVLQAMLRDGIVIKGKAGYLPLHPRLAISNLYRLSTLKNKNVRQKRVKVDAITARLVKFREDIQKW